MSYAGVTSTNGTADGFYILLLCLQIVFLSRVSLYRIYCKEALFLVLDKTFIYAVNLSGEKPHTIARPKYKTFRTTETYEDEDGAWILE